MSMYNLVHGMNPLAGILMAALGLSRNDVPRFRDCYWTGTHIAVHTRTGGGNRDTTSQKNRAVRTSRRVSQVATPIPSGPWNDTLRTVEGFSHDEDDDFDSTYATFFFTPSPTVSEALKGLSAEDATPAQKWEKFFAELQSGERTPQATRVAEALAPILTAIHNDLKESR